MTKEKEIHAYIMNNKTLYDQDKDFAELLDELLDAIEKKTIRGPVEEGAVKKARELLFEKYAYKIISNSPIFYKKGTKPPEEEEINKYKYHPSIKGNIILYEQDSEFRRLIKVLLESEDTKSAYREIKKKYDSEIIGNKLIYYKKGTSKPTGNVGALKSAAKVMKVLKHVKF